jgi:hypothetical protein
MALKSISSSTATELKRRIAGLRRRSTFVPYSGSFALAQELQQIVDAVREQVLPKDPDKAYELADAFLQSDKRTFERVDDSDGSVGDVYRESCLLWLEAASRAGVKRDWVGRIYMLAKEDDYGARDALLRGAATLLSEHELRRLVAHFEDDARQARPGRKGFDFRALSAWSGIGLLALALRDPRLYERAAKMGRDNLNDLQLVDVARRYLEFGDAETAVSRLQAMADRDNPERLDLLARSYDQLGKGDEQIEVLWCTFETYLTLPSYDRLIDLLPADRHETARGRARRIARDHAEAYSAVRFLLHAGWPDDAEGVLSSRLPELADTFYGALLDLAGMAEKAGRPVIEAACYRLLVLDILRAARLKAYGYAARYLRKLEKLDRTIENYGALDDHDAFVEELRQEHGRKYAFWRRVDGVSGGD